MPSKRLNTGISALILSAGIAATGTAQAGTLKEAVEEALQTSPELLAASNQRYARDKELRGAKAGYYPKVDLQTGIGSEYTDSPASRAASGDPADHSIEKTREEVRLTASQMLFDGFLTRSEVERQTARVKSQAYRVLDVAEQTVLATVRNYLNVARARNVLKLAEDNLVAHKKIEDRINRRSKSGVGRKADLDQIRTRVALAENNVVSARVNQLDAEAQYQKVVGTMPSESEPVESWKDKLPADLQTALDSAYATNPILQTALADIEAAEKQYEAAKSPMRPRLDLELESRADNDLDGTNGHDTNHTLMVRMRWNLYNGGADQARLEERAFNINEAKDVRDNTRRQLEEAVRLAWNAHEATALQVKLLKAQAEFARLTRDAYAKQFNIGQRTLLDLLNTENELFDARVEHERAKMDYLFAERRVLAAMGALVESYGIAAPEASQMASAE